MNGSWLALARVALSVPLKSAAAALLALALPLSAWAADPQIASLVDNPDPVPAGGLYTYTAVVDNYAADAALNTRLQFSVPAGATFVSATPGSPTCVPVSATLVECNLGTVGALGADTRTIVFTWRATGPGPTTINATATLLADNDTNNGNNVQSATTTVVQGANLGLTKTANPEPVVGGANITYTLTASNTGPNDAGDLALTDNLSPSSTFVSASGSGWSCAHSAGVVTCNRTGPHAVGAGIAPVTIVATVNASGGTVTNSATVAPATGASDPDSSNNTATVNSSVLPGADVRIASKSVISGTPAVAGQNVSFRINPRNTGPAAATNAVVTDTLPANWTFVSASGPNWSCGAAGQTVTCSRASFPVGATDNITVVATAPSNAQVGPTGTTYTNTASITSTSTDPTPGNNSGSVDVTVLPDGADLRLTKSKTPDPVAQGGTLTSTLTVTNNGPRTATGPLKVVDVLNGETFVSASPVAWSCVPTGAVVECTHANVGGLAVGASLPNLVITTTATSSGSLSNAACTGSSLPLGSGSATASPPAEGDPNNTNDCASAVASSTTVQPDLAITKTTSTPSGGDKVVSITETSVTYTLVVTNASLAPQGATGVRVTDTVPAYVTSQSSIDPIVPVVSGGSATFSCSSVNNAVTCVQTGGVLAQGEFVTIPIKVNRVMTDGTFTNTATVTNTVEGDPNLGNNSASDTVTIAPITDVELSGKTVSPASVRAGETATYVISYRNNGVSTAAGVNVGDVFTFGGGDTGLTVVSISSSKAGSSCSVAAGAVLNAGSPSYTCAIGSLAPSESQTITMVVRVNFMAGNPARTFNNTASITTTSAENATGGDNGNNSRSAALSVTAAAIDLLVNKTDVVDPVGYSTGATFISYHVRVTSNGPSYGTNVRVEETATPPAGKRIRFVCDTTTLGGSTCNSTSLCSVTNVTSGVGTAIPTFTCQVPAGNSTTGLNVGELASGQSKDIFLRFEVVDQPAANGDIFNNVAVVRANEPDPFTVNDTEGETTTVRQRVDLRVTKAASASPVSLMQPFNWTINVVNNGPGNSLQTDVTDTLPAGMQTTGPITFTRTLPAGSGTCSQVGQTVTCALGQLDGTGSATITVPVRITSFPSGGTASNSATVDTDPGKTGGVDSPGGNNTGTGTVSVTKSSITGLVFEDRVRDGANAGTPQASGVEPRLSNVTITLTGTDAFGNPISLTTTTDSNGVYLFDNLPPSSGAGYTITQTQPPGYVNCPEPPPLGSLGGTYNCGGQTGNSVYSQVVVPANTNGINYNFPELRFVSLGGFVYIDTNVNGVRDAGVDTPIPGATVRLLDANTLTLIATTTTDSTGAYSFSGLDPLVWYAVEELQPTTPAGLAQGPVNLGLIGGVSCAGTCWSYRNEPVAGSDLIRYINLSGGLDGTQFNFGEYQLASVSGTVYLDRNRNGSLDTTPTDGRLTGITLRLVQGADCTSGTTLQTTTTDGSGNYSFAGVIAGGNYLVCETAPAGYGNGSVNPGTGNSSPGATVIAINALSPSGSTSNHFGVLPGSILGSVFADTGSGTVANNNNGVRDAGEAGIANVPVTLTGTDILGNPVSLSTTTDSSGNYRFDDLLQSNGTGYTVTEGSIPPASGVFNDGRDNLGTAGGNTTTNDVFAGIVLGAGVQGTAYDFGELPQASITGSVYIDRNRNGAPDGTPTDAPLPGVTLRLVQGADCTSGTTLQTVVTDSSGNYSFAAVSAGQSYLVCQTQPAGYLTGGENPGTGNSSSTANVIAINNLLGSGSTGNRFAERVGAITGSVFADTGSGTVANNNNGVRDAGEAGIANVPVTLTGTDILGNPVSLSTTTDSSGNYRFDDLLQSNGTGYTVTEGSIPPASGVFNDGRDNLGTAGGNTTTNDVFAGIVLGAGVQGTAYDFGELPQTSISGSVYVDRNRNGAPDGTPTDAPLPGVTLRLVQGADCTSGTTVQTVVTGVNGAYLFTAVSVGQSYLVCQTQPGGYLTGGETPGTGNSSPGANVIAVPNLSPAGSTGNHFGERVGAITGSVFADTGSGTVANNNNGVRDAGEAGIANVPVTLTGTDILGNPVSLSTTTDSSGNYRFDDLLQSNATGYTLTEGSIPPASGVFNDGRDNLGTAGGNTTTNDVFAGIVLGAGVQGTAYDFGELPQASITGSVYIDRNRNGAPDGTPTDAPLPGVTLRLVQGADCTSGTTLQTVVTDSSGNYSFPAVSVGQSYLVCQTQPVGYATGGETPAVGNSSGGSNAIVIGTLPPTGSTGNLFAEQVGSLAGSVILDADNNGARNGADTGIAGVTISLSGVDANGLAVNRTTTTDSSGNFRFDDLLAAGTGGYTLTEQAAQPQVLVSGVPVTTLNGRTAPGTVAGNPLGTASTVASTPSRISSIALAAGGNSIDNLFGEILPVAVAGVVFVDGNNNGLQELPGDLGLPGVTIVVTGTDDTGTPVSRTLTTSPDGRFSVTDLRPGTYTLTEPVQPLGTTNGQTIPGTGGGTGTAPAVLPSSIGPIVLTQPGSRSLDNRFAEIASNGVISGKVWLDSNANGLADGPEAGIAGVTITLTGTDLGNNPVALTTTTDALGNYAFTGLSPGAYVVSEPAQPAGTVNGATLAGTAGGTATPVATVPSRVSAVNLGIGQSGAGYDFLEIPSGTVSGRVFADPNNNGLPESGESGLPGVTLTLTGTNDLGEPVTLTTTTDADGNYRFPDVRPGSYTLTQPTQPPGTVNGLTTPGTLGGTPTGVDTVPSRISAITLTPGASSLNNYFAEINHSPDLRTSKRHLPTRFTVGLPGSYLVEVRNAGEIASSGEIVVSDRLPTGLTLAATPTGSGWVCAGAVGASQFSCRSSTVVNAGAVHPGVITANVNVLAAAQAASPVNNAVLVEGGGESPLRAPTPAERDAFNGNVPSLPLCTATIDHNACRDATPVQLAASVSGTAWMDIGGSSRVLDGGDRRLPGWQVEVIDVATGLVVGSTTTAADGGYRVGALTPGVELAIRFRDPTSGVVFGYPVNGEVAPGSSGAPCDRQKALTDGVASSCVNTGVAPQLTVVLAPGQDLPQQSLPVDPSGVVYDAVLRQPVAGAVVTLAPVGACAGYNPTTQVVGATLGGYVVNGNAISMTVGNDGFYQFLFGTNAPASCTFGLTVVPPAGYSFVSSLIPPTAGPLTPPGGPGSTFPVQPQAGVPTGAVGTATTYYLQVVSGSQGANIIHNHVPLDPAAPTALTLSKTGDKAVAEVGDIVRYSITVQLTAGTRPNQVTVLDKLPAGFTYIPGTAMVGTTPLANPAGAPGPQLAFNLGAMPASGQLVLHYRARVNVGSAQGDGINRARAHACGTPNGCITSTGSGGGTVFTPVPGSVQTNEGQHRVRVQGGVFGTQACFAGKIFVDCNNNHVQDREELGIPGVRLILQDGTMLISDVEGKYSFCGLPPKSHVLKVDPLTLPRGSRLTTSSNRNLGDANSLWLDLKSGELHRADFVEGSCSNTVLEQVKARRAQGEVRAPETEKKGGPALRFDSKAHQLNTLTSPQQGTDGANQLAPKAREGTGVEKKSVPEQNKPPSTTPMNQPPPQGRDSATAPSAGASHAAR